MNLYAHSPKASLVSRLRYNGINEITSSTVIAIVVIRSAHILPNNPKDAAIDRTLCNLHMYIFRFYLLDQCHLPIEHPRIHNSASVHFARI